MLDVIRGKDVQTALGILTYNPRYASSVIKKLLESAIANAENNNYWIRRTYNRFMILALIFCAGELLIIPLAKPIMFIWLGEENVKNINISTSVLFSILACLMMICSVLSSIANGVGKLKVQAVCYIIGAIIKIPLSVILTKIIGSWNGVVIANIICIGLYCIIQPFYMRKVYSDIS